jgi:ELWxxDGT repeat protein
MTQSQYMYFAALDGEGGYDLWVTDGTTTEPVSGLDNNAGVCGSYEHGLIPSYITSFGDDVLFAGYDSGYNNNTISPDNSPNLWISNGTAIGTTEIGGVTPGNLAGIPSKIAGGSPNGLNPIPNPSSSSRNTFVAFGDEVFFIGTNAAGDDDLWVTNGTEMGTKEVGGTGNAQIVNASMGWNPSNLSAFGAGVLFNANDTSEGDTYAGLWITDGSGLGTVEIGGLQNVGILDHANKSFVADDMIALGNLMLFSADNASDDNAIWVTDGTATGTIELGGSGNAAIVGADNNFGDDFANAVRFGNRIFFQGGDKTGAAGLWVTDGTASGTYEIGGSANSGIIGADSNGLNPTDLTVDGQEVLFNGIDSAGQHCLWVTDGTASGTKEIGQPAAPLPDESTNGLNPRSFVSLGNGNALFIGTDLNGEEALWVTDGTLSGTQELGGLGNQAIPGISSTGFGLSATSSIVGGNAIAYFVGYTNNNVATLWETDGTTYGTRIVVPTNGTIATVSLNASDMTISDISASAFQLTGGGNSVSFGSTPKDVTLCNTGVGYDTLIGSCGTVNISSASATIEGDGLLINFVGGAGNIINLYGDNSVGNTVISDSANFGTLNLMAGLSLVIGGGSIINTMIGGSQLKIMDTIGSWDWINSSNANVTLINAQSTVCGGGDTIVMDGSSTDFASLYNTNGKYDSVFGSNGTIRFNNAVAAVIGGRDTIMMDGSSDFANLYNTNGKYDSVFGSNGTIGLNNAVAVVIGGDDTIMMDGSSTDFANLYNTNGKYDIVLGSNGTVGLNNAVAAVVGGGYTIMMDGSSTNFANLYNTNGKIDCVYGSNGLIGLNNAVVAVADGGYTIMMDGSSTDRANLYNTNGKYDSVLGSNGTIGLNNAVAAVVGGGYTIMMDGSSTNFANLYKTNWNADCVYGSNGLIGFNNAVATVVGDYDALNFYSGSNWAVLSGTKDACVFSENFGLDTIGKFNLSDTLQFSTADFASWSALTSHLSYANGSAVITFDSNDVVTLTNVAANSLTASQFNFV